MTDYGKLAHAMADISATIGQAAAAAGYSADAQEWLRMARVHVAQARDLIEAAADALEREHEMDARRRYAREAAE